VTGKWPATPADTPARNAAAGLMNAREREADGTGASAYLPAEPQRPGRAGLSGRRGRRMGRDERPSN
jgi:hypothetical protein